MSTAFVHLHVHTEYSLVDSLNRIKPLVKAAAEAKMPALAVTDQSNFYGLIKFYNAALAAGVKPLLGADLWLENPDEPARPYRVPFLCQNQQGYKNLIDLISRGYQSNQIDDRAVVRREWLESVNEGLIVLSGANYGDVGQAILRGNDSVAEQRLAWWQQHFPGRYYLELQRTGRPGDEQHVGAAVALAERFQLPVVATNDVMFLQADDFEAHEARVCINESTALDDPRREHRFSDQQYLKSADEMAALFSDLPSAIENTVEIARRCTVEVELGTYYLPEYPIPDDLEQDAFFQGEFSLEKIRADVEAAMQDKWAGREQEPDYQQQVRLGIYFHKVSYEGLEERLKTDHDPSATDFPVLRQQYLERLRFELNIILQMGFPGYFLIVMDFIQWAKDHDIPVGPGRGSGAGSLVAYAQQITDLNPLKYDLLFERFLNPERVSMPDFDVDFCMEKRDQVINYVADRYGRDAVSQIVTFGTLAAKAVVRDVARVQGKSYGLADRISKMIPGTPGMTLAKALDEVPELKAFIREDEEAQEIWEMAEKLEGITRQTGKHAGGVVIAPTRLTDFAPLLCEEDGSGLMTQYDKNDVEAAGLVKFDFLGLRTLTIIDWALAIINGKRSTVGEEPIDITHIPQNDAAAFKMLKAAQTTAVFQLESRGMKALIKQMQPDNLEEMIALVALFRPGPLDSGMVENFINRKHGRETVSYPDATWQHESLKPILESTYGIIVYQEQVMQIAQTLAGYTLGGADLLRRAMGKKKPEEMEKQRRIFADGAAAKGIDADLATRIFDLVEKFAGYGFNKSHSAAYALVSYQTLWLKAHYPAAFMAATMSSELDNTDKVVIFLEECRELGLTVLPPDVNQGEYMFTVNEQDHIVFGLGAVKGVGEGPVEAIVEARRSGGPFSDLFDFCARVNMKKLGKRVIEALIKSGALDQLGPNRALLMQALPDAIRAAEQNHENAAAGISDLFGDVQLSADDNPYVQYGTVHDWPIKYRLAGEKDTLGLYLTGHPIDEYEAELSSIVTCRLNEVAASDREQVLAGLVIDIRRMRSKQGNDMMFVTLDDRTARLEFGLFGEQDPSWQPFIEVGQVIFIKAEVTWNKYREENRIKATDVVDVSGARARFAQALVVHWPVAPQAGQNGAEQFAGHLRELLLQAQSELGRANASVPMHVAYGNEAAQGELRLGEQWRAPMTDEFIYRLRDRFGPEAVSLRF
ncbi:MAG: DNA polymerase III subunit alpha [Natronospirillum sp.]|uniref:DNA polymerase III subunit alpha n=1 Tax=Natronospirillum sp. TaxID=2812955 RepID=UPI0025D8FF77|nr:DNA polymerase III subunit alpha [Natronospirillum sp.]MCH8552334.1 DNA polymerase III subunit alpha [Natronospirillum sp.]